MNNEKISANLKLLLAKNPQLPTVLAKLHANGIRYGLYAGAHVSVLTNNRIPTDIDLLIHDDDIDRVKTLFPGVKIKNNDGVFLYIDNDELIEFMSLADVKQENNTYPFRLTDTAVKKLITYEVEGSKINLVDPADSILLKSILQRGPEQGKHDIEDIQAVIKTMKVDTTYLRQRLLEANALEKATPLFLKLGITL